MNCLNCHQPIESGAAFCGNCGQPVSSTTNSSRFADVLANNVSDNNSNQTFVQTLAVNGVTTKPPGYAVPSLSEQRNHLRATMSLVVGLLGAAAAVQIPYAGLVLGIIGIILATMSMRSAKHFLSKAGLIASIVATLVGLGSWAYVISSNAKQSSATSKSIASTNATTAYASTTLTTTCYSIIFATKLNIQNASGNCNMNAYNAGSFTQSTEAYKIYSTSSSVTSQSFTALAKQAIEADIKQSLPGYTISKETAGQFAASQAYFVTASDTNGISVIEAAVLHPNSHAENFFVLVHFLSGSTADLLDLQLGWQWL